MIRLSARLRMLWAGLFLGPISLTACVEQAASGREHGVVLEAHFTDQAGANSGAGAVIGMAAGAAVGAQFGNGVGQALAAAAGAVAGEAAGSNAEAAAQNHSGIAYAIRLDYGAVVTVTEHLYPNQPIFKPGDSVVVQTVGHEQRVLPGTSP